MNALIPEQVELEPKSEPAKAVEALVAEMDLDAILEEIQIRASSLTPVMERILEFHPSSHWAGL